MKSRPRFNLFVAIPLALLIALLGGTYWFWAKSPLALLRETPISEPTAAMFVPKDAPLVMSLLSNPDRLQGLRQLRTPLKKRGESRAEFDRLKRSLLADTDLDYDRDLKPWLGDEVTLAVTSLDGDRDEANGTQPGYLVTLGVKNPDKSREFLDLFWQNQVVAGAELVFEDYKGVKLIYSQPKKVLFPWKGKTKKLNWNPFADPGARRWASAMVGNRFVLFANSPNELRQAINRVQASDLNLSSTAAYQQALDNLTDRRLGLAWVNLPQLRAWIDKTPVPGPSQDVNALAVAFSANQKGLLADTIWLGAPQETLNFPVLSTPLKVLEYIPKQSSLVVSGVDLDQLWQKLVAAASENELLEEAIESLRKPLEAHWNISLPQQIFSWVRGEYALALLPKAGESDLDWVFVAEKSDSSHEGIADLDAIAASRGYSVGPFTLKGEQRIVAWTQLVAAEDDSAPGPRISLNARVRGVHGTADNYEISSSSIEAMDEVFKAQAKGSLVTSKDFRPGLDGFRLANNGYFYIDWSKNQPPIQQKFPALKFLELAGKPVFGHLKSLTTTSYKNDAGFLQTELFLRLRP